MFGIKRVLGMAGMMPNTTAMRNEDSPKEKRLNIVLPETLYSEMAALARRVKMSITDLVRLGLALVKIAVEESRKGNKLIVTDSDGNPLRELVLPGV
jgi:hypothetical protein